MKRTLLVLAGVALLGFTATLPMVRHAASAARPQSTGPATPARAQRPAPAVPIPFVSACKFSHRLADDPIVRPNIPGASHSHDFFGNVTTAANSTLQSLQQGNTTCSRTNDTAAYWVPTLMVNGQPATPDGINAYYRTGRRDPGSIQPFPSGLRIVAGNSKASGPQSAQVTTFGCRGATGRASAASVPVCETGRGKGLTVSVHFPDCWNGRDLDSADHMSHMAYSRRGACPPSHPVAVPALTVHVKYNIAGGPGVSLASGPYYTAHADFFNAWDQSALAHLVSACIDKQVKCGARGDTAKP